jgi:glycosyltransferase involved in cell wall biosynthesis
MLVGPMPPLKGGITTFLLNLMASPLSTRFEFIAYSISRPQKKNVIDNWGYSSMLRGGISRIVYGVTLSAWRFLAFPFFLAGRKIDLVQTHGSDYQSFWEAVAYAMVSRLMGRRVLLRIGGAFDLFHAGSSPIVRRLIEISLGVPHCVIVQSQFTQKYVSVVSQCQNILILPNWTRAPIFEQERPRRETPIFMFIAGNEARRKGIEEVIGAAGILERRASQARFRIVATVPQLVERINELGLTNISRLDGIVEHERLLEIMRESDVFLLPSHGEGFPNSLLEAMACGLPSVVTPVAAVPEIIATSGGALVVPVGDAEALAAAIERLTLEPQLRKDLGEQARRSICHNFTADKVLTPLENAYRELLS